MVTKIAILLSTYNQIDRSADNSGDGERVTEGVCVLKGEGAAIGKGLAIVNETVIITEALEYARVNEASGAEPAAAEVNSGDVTTGDANVHDLHGVGWYTAGKWSCGALVNHNVSF